MAKVSVIIPNHNYAKYLNSALDSVLYQTLQDWECIVIDDGSGDDSVRIIKQYIKRDKRFKLIQKKHQGIPQARNAGLDVATGDYIAFLDADDCYSDIALETLYQIARMTDADMVGGKTLLVGDKFKFLPAGNAAYTPHDFYSESNPSRYFCASGSQNWFWIWRRIYKRKFIGDTRFSPKLNFVGEDIAFMMELGWRAENMVDSMAIVVYHRKHMTSISRQTRGADFYSYFPAILEHAQNMRNKYDGAFWRIFYESITNYLMFETIFKPKMYKNHQKESREALLKCSGLIPREYLGWKKKFMFWYLSKLKNVQD
ncbi:MAG: glycosyltransferase [Rickettsiales bacterium]|jgi:glycosyltransferase involved in cell wall biosynthesis|nr:glycosyltransferase [Rickettsiales bacterium]